MDGVFRVALPNGKYKVTCHFCSGGSNPQEINIIANGKKKIKKLKVPRGNRIVDGSYTTTVTDEWLTQVIYVGKVNISVGGGAASVSNVYNRCGGFPSSIGCNLNCSQKIGWRFKVTYSVTNPYGTILQGVTKIIITRKAIEWRKNL